MDQKPEEETQSAEAAIQAALAALKRGDRLEAQRLAEQAAGLAPESEAPWLILSALAEPEESVMYALRALEVHPESLRARQALSWAQTRLGTGPLKAKTPLAEQPSEEKPREEQTSAEKPFAETPVEEKAEGPTARVTPEAATAGEPAAEEVPEAPPETPVEEAAEISAPEAASPAVEAAAEVKAAEAENPPVSPEAVPPETVPSEITEQPARRAASSRTAMWVIILLALLVILIAAGVIFLPPLLRLY